MTNLSSNLTFLRVKNGISQFELGFLLKKKQATVSTWEKNTAKPDIDTLIWLCNYFGVTPNQMLLDDLTQGGGGGGVGMEVGAMVYSTQKAVATPSAATAFVETEKESTLLQKMEMEIKVLKEMYSEVLWRITDGMKAPLLNYWRNICYK